MSDRTDAILQEKYSNVPDWEVADSLNLETINVDGDSPLIVIQNALVMANAWGYMEDDSVNSPDRDKRAFLLKTLCLFRAPSAESLGWGDNPLYPPTIAAILDGLIGYGYIDNTFKEFVMSQRYVKIPKWNPPFTAREVGLTRGGI